MSRATLDLLITIRGNEAILKEIQHRFNDENDECTLLCNAVATSTHQLLIAAGVTDNLELDTHCGQVKSQLAASGGLNAMEWLDTGETSS